MWAAVGASEQAKEQAQAQAQAPPPPPPPLVQTVAAAAIVSPPHVAAPVPVVPACGSCVRPSGAGAGSRRSSVKAGPRVGTLACHCAGCVDLYRLLHSICSVCYKLIADDNEDTAKIRRYTVKIFQ